MSKLFKVKEWLSVENAAKHLAMIFGEEVSEVDRREAWLTATKQTDTKGFLTPIDVSVFMGEPESISHLPHPQIF